MSIINNQQQQQQQQQQQEVQFQKPDTIDDSPVIYEKPNAYDEEPPVVITASRHGSKSSKMTVDSFASRYFQKREPTILSCSTSSSFISSTTTTKDTGTYYSPNTPIESPPLSPKQPLVSPTKRSKLMYNSQITSFILSQSIPTTQTTFGHHHQEEEEEEEDQAEQQQQENKKALSSYYVLPSSPANSIIEQQGDDGDDTETLKNKSTTNIAAATAALLSNHDSEIVSSFFLRKQSSLLLQNNNSNNLLFYNKQNSNNNKRQVISTNKKASASNNTIVYSIRKASLLKPNQHYIYLHIDHHQQDEEDEDIMIYRKIQPYTWWGGGYQSMLYCNKNDGQGIKVAEARTKRIFGGKDNNIIIESADYVNSEIQDISTSLHIPNLKNIPATSNIHSQDLIKKSQSNILFEYEIWFNGSRMRWKRPSLLSHDFTCDIKLTRQETKLYYQQLQKMKKKGGSLNNGNNKSKKKKKQNNNEINKEQEEDQKERETTTTFIDSDSDNDQDDHDNHTHKSCRRWKLIAKFDSKNMSYLNKEFGKLSIDLDILNQVEKDRCDLLEANIVMTCCTLIDLIRDIMGVHHYGRK